MALRVDTQLSSSVYFPGDDLSCAIQVANNFPDINPTLPILWISVQVFGYIQVHKYWKLSSIDVFSDADVLGSYVLKQPIFQEKSKKQRIHFFATDEQVVACDLKLKEYQTYVYSIKLPQTLEGGVSPLPPSYPTFIPNEIMTISGNENKTSYNSRIRYILSISLKTALNQPLQVIQLPIHVLSPLCSTNKISFSYNSYKQLHRIGKSKEVKKIITTQDPVVIDELKIIKKVEEEEEKELEIIYRPSTYRISKDDEVFVHFSISSSFFTLGDTIGCTLSFSPTSPVHCFQTTVTLECREQINAELLTPDMNKPARSFIRKLVYGEYQESSVSSLQSSFTFNIPVDAIHEFQSDIVIVKWYLNFEFLVGERKDITNVRRFENKKKEVVTVEQISWELPIKVSVYDHPSELRCPSTLVWNIQP